MANKYGITDIDDSLYDFRYDEDDFFRIKEGLTDGERAVFSSYWNGDVSVQAALGSVKGHLREAGIDIDRIGTKNMFRLADFFAC